MKNRVSLFTSLNLRRWSVYVLSTFALVVTANATSGLIHKWSADGDASDSIGNANCTITNIDGSANLDVTFVTGQTNQAFGFDAKGLIDFGTTNVAAFGTNDFAIAFWVQCAGTNNQSLLTKYDTNSGTGFAISVSNGLVSCTLSQDVATNGDNIIVTGRDHVNDGGFHYVVVQRNAADLFIFVDGVISAKATSPAVLNIPELSLAQVTNEVPVYDDMGNPVLDGSGNPVTTNEVDIISQPSHCIAGQGLADGLVGALDEIAIYGRTLTPYEIYSAAHPGVGLAIIDQPLDQRTVAGRLVILHLLAVGVDPITYQWQFNGYDIPGAISNNLVLDSAQVFDSGTYTVVVSNPTGDLTSRAAVVTVTNLTTPTDGLIARWSAEGTAKDSIGGHDGITQNVTYGPGVLGTAFNFNGNGSVSCGNVIGGMGTNDFSIAFWMRTTFAGGVESLLAQRPFCENRDCASFRLFNRSSSGQPLNFVAFEIGDHNDLWNIASPKTIPSGLHFNDGVFHHVAIIRQGRALSLYGDGTLIQRTFSQAPILVQNEGNFVIGTEACVGQDETVPFRGSIDEVEVFNRALSDEDVYNDYSPNPTLTIIRPPQPVTVVEGMPAKMAATVTGLPTITYQWLLNGTDISGATNSSYELAATQLSDAGIYTVKVTNALSQLTSAGGVLTVVPAATILPGLVNRWSAEGNTDDLLGNSTTYGYEVGFTAGVHGQAFSIDGNQTAIGLDVKTGNFGTNDFTIDLWAHSVAGGGLAAKVPAFDFWIGGGTVHFDTVDDSGQRSSITNQVPFNTSTFHHIAVARKDATNLLLYIDGQLDSQTNIPFGNLHGDLPMCMGGDMFQHPNFNGEIDEVEIYNRALNSSEILYLYNQYANSVMIKATVRDINATVGSSFSLTFGHILSGSIAKFQWSLNGTPIPGATNFDLDVSNMDASKAGIYTVTATDPSGHSVTVMIARVSNRLCAGSYNGLFYYDGDTTDDTSGFITLALTSSQSYSGSIKQQGQSYPVSGRFTGKSLTMLVKRPGKAPLTVMIPSAGVSDGQLTGVVRDATRNIPLVMQRVAYDALHKAPQAGDYTLSLFGLNSSKAPNGHGFGMASVGSTGRVNFNGWLSDGTTVSQNVGGMDKTGGFPLYAWAYKGKATVLGWLSFNKGSANACSGTLRWMKSHTAGGTNYTSGFATKIPVTGSTFTPVEGGLGIGLGNSSIVLDGAKIYSAVNNPIVGTNLNQIIFSQTGAPQGTLSVVSKFGQFSGPVYNPVTHSYVQVKGTVLQNQGYAVGYFLNSSGLSGRVVLQHN